MKPVLVCTFLFVSLINSLSLSTEISPVAVVDAFISSLKNEDIETAASYWDSQYIDLCNRFDISYANVPAKFDCASPVIRYLKDIKSGTYSITTELISSMDGIAQVRLRILSSNDTLSYVYHLRRLKDDWQITSPLIGLAQESFSIDTKYCRLFFKDSSRINDFALRELDRFIETTAELLTLSAETVMRLASQKILYYLVDEDDIVILTGYAAKGYFDIPIDAIVTAYLPHNHELVHLLTNLSMDSPSLYTMPFMQEGLACHLGGRWGRSPGVVKYVGFVSLNFGLAGVGDILSSNSFYQKTGGADVSYPISSLFVNYIIRNAGMTTLLDLYSQLSGSGEYTANLSEADVKEKIASATGHSWSEIETGFNDWWKRYYRFGVNPFNSQLSTDTAQVQINETIPVAIWELTGSYLFEVNLAASENGGVLLFTKKSEKEDHYTSSLYTEHRRGDNYQGQRFGIKFSPAEVGVYDYYVNELLASFVYGFESDFVSGIGDPGVYRFTIDKRIFGVEDILAYDIQVKKL